MINPNFNYGTLGDASLATSQLSGVRSIVQDGDTVTYDVPSDSTGGIDVGIGSVARRVTAPVLSVSRLQVFPLTNSPVPFIKPIGVVGVSYVPPSPDNRTGFQKFLQSPYAIGAAVVGVGFFGFLLYRMAK